MILCGPFDGEVRGMAEQDIKTPMNPHEFNGHSSVTFTSRWTQGTRLFRTVQGADHTSTQTSQDEGLL